MKKIKNIVFDLGGVIMNLDVPKTIEAFKALGIKNIVNDTGHHYQYSFFYDFEIGKISENDFLESLFNLSDKSPNHQEIIKAWNAMILDMPKERIDFLKELRKNYTLFLLSNTNKIHQKEYLDTYKNSFNSSFNDLFKKAYYSHEIGIRKPDEAIFNFILEDSNLVASETLFVDDAISNIEGAQKVGIKTYHVQNYDTVNILKVLNR
ncbi:MAG: HAD family phosphatase [Polaribacter sp.]|nr:HAD family phosphatase [Polaribacter sp.]